MEAAKQKPTGGASASARSTAKGDRRNRLPLRADDASAVRANNRETTQLKERGAVRAVGLALLAHVRRCAGELLKAAAEFGDLRVQLKRLLRRRLLRLRHQILDLRLQRHHLHSTAPVHRANGMRASEEEERRREWESQYLSGDLLRSRGIHKLLLRLLLLRRRHVTAGAHHSTLLRTLRRAERAGRRGFGEAAGLLHRLLLLLLCIAAVRRVAR